MSSGNGFTLLVAVCNFGWGSLGKFRLILDKLPSTEVALYGDSGINCITADLLGTRHNFVHCHPKDADIALVINDPAAANQIAELGVPVIYVDSLPYLWALPEEVPAPDTVSLYCAQKYPSDRLPLSIQLRHRHDIHWIEPIVPASAPHLGGQGVVVNLGGLQSHLVGDTVEAYLSLVLIPLVEELKVLGWPVFAICGNLPVDTCHQLGDLLPDCQTIGRQSPYDFERVLKAADLLITSPGSTTILQALSLQLPTLLLPPQNLSQILNVRLFSSPSASTMSWPASVMSPEIIEQLRPEGEDIVLTYIYRSICTAAEEGEAVRDVVATIRSYLRAIPENGVLDLALIALGSNGAGQVAQLVRRAMLVPSRTR